MKEQIGKICCCDRCGKEIFLKYIGTESFAGGFARESYFDKFPPTWKHYSLDGESYRLCDECSSALDEFLDDFMK